MVDIVRSDKFLCYHDAKEDVTFCRVKGDPRTSPMANSRVEEKCDRPHTGTSSSAASSPLKP